MEKRYEANVHINTLEANFENYEKREKALKFEIQTTISELDSTRLTKEDISKTFYEIEQKRNKIASSLEQIAKQKEEADQKIKAYNQDISQYTEQERIKSARLKFLVETEKEKEGYTKSVKALLLACDKDASLKKGVEGVLSSLIAVDKKHQTAIEMALGAALQNIVTSTEEEAKRLVEYLRKNNLGRATFLPITSVKGKKLENINTKGIEGVIGIATDLIKFDTKYEQILFNLIGRTVIVDNMDHAVKLAKQNKYGFKIVTLEGDIVSATGGITGGSVMQKTVNILGRTREIEELQKEVKELQEKIKKITKQKEQYEESIENVMEEVASLEAQLQEIEIVYATDKQKLVAVEESIEKTSARLEKLKQEAQNITKQKEEIIKQKEEDKQEIEKLTKQIEEWNVQIEEFVSTNKEEQKYIDDLNFDITNLKISVSSFDESKASIEEIVQRIEQDIENCNKSIEVKEQQTKEMEQENEQLEHKIKEIEQKIVQIKEEVKNSDTKVEDLKQKRVQRSEKLKKTEEEILEQFHIIEELKAQIVKIDVKKTKLEQDLEEVVNKMWEEYELTPNKVENYEKPTNIVQTTKQVNNLRNQIRDLGSINMDAIEEYKETSKRYDFMCEQRLDLENSIEKLRKVIQDMTNIMKEQFEKQFKIINHNFGEVFKELFGGGKAELILSDETNILECGIEIQVQPPGKKLQNMTLLSGGEKAFTAIALLFAILQINPAPFCVLDEIEAALDDVNVYRFADYLKKFSSNTQFLVITHRKGTMEAADTVYGITMQENGISKMLSMKLATQKN